MSLRTVKQLDLEALESMPTQRLLSYLRQLQKCENSLETSDYRSDEVTQIKGIVFKSSKIWKAQYELVKSVLNSRPNIER
jgi:hypothetical protein